MNRFLLSLGTIAAILSATPFGHSQSALVGPGGYTNAFGTQPAATEWASSSRAGASSDAYDMDTDVNASIAAGNVTNRTTASAQNPPLSLVQAAWSSSGLYLQTRPTGHLRFLPARGRKLAGAPFPNRRSAKNGSGSIGPK